MLESTSLRCIRKQRLRIERKNSKNTKKVARSEKEPEHVGGLVVLGKKREGDAMDIEEQVKAKRARDNDVEMNHAENIEAGLSEQLRKSQ
jgi:hypothetical protein